MSFRCEECSQVFDNEDSLAVFADMPGFTGRIGRDGSTSRECPLCGGIVRSLDEQLLIDELIRAAG